MGGIPRRIGLLLSILGFTFCIYLLLTRSDWLLIPIIESPVFPLGTLVAWVAYLSLAFGVYFTYPQLMFPLTRFESFMKVGWMALALLSLLWPLISYALAGNWAFDFSFGPGFQGSEPAFWGFVYFSAFLGLALLLWPLLIIINLFTRGAR